MELHPLIKNTLEQIDFIKRYQDISTKIICSSDERFRTYDNNEVLVIFKELGYKAEFNKKENFFKVVDELPPFRFQFNISLKAGHTELIWGVRENSVILTCGGPWMMIKRLLDGTDENLKYPIFRNYDDLKEILKEVFVMYEDFKRVLLVFYENSQ